MEELGHSGHDFERLRKGWEAIADLSGWHLSVLTEESGHPILVIENEASRNRIAGGAYLSAGVHGDECAPVWGLLRWAERHLADLPEGMPVLIFPCLNPYGLIENTRLNEAHRDLNRHFQNDEIPLIDRWQRYLKGRQFDVAVNLHEDYDATGMYLYELTRVSSSGHELLAACEHLMPRETSSLVDGSDFENGLLKRDSSEEEMRRVVEEELDGWPEAIYLYLRHAIDSYTFETPSEMDLLRRIETHVAFLSAVIAK